MTVISESVRERRTAALARGREIYMAETAHRALDDPARLARAARIVRAALERGVLTQADLTPLPDPRA